MRIDNARPYVFDETALQRAADRLEELASPLTFEDARTDAAGVGRIQTGDGAALLWTVGTEAIERATRHRHRDLAP
jgi:hypothetical protein